MPKVYPIILAGGAGTRLWPLSRKSYPKQFADLLGGETLFQQSALRLTTSDQVEFASHITLTSSDYRFIVGEQLNSVGLGLGHILIEPEAKNTAPAILAATLFAYAIDPDATLLVAPSDHSIQDNLAFHSAIKMGFSELNRGNMITFGVSPTHADTGFGYLELVGNVRKFASAHRVRRFVEKPKRDLAEKMLNAGNYFWNAGIFLFRAIDMITAFEAFAPRTLNFTKEAVENAHKDLDFLRLNSSPWNELENISIDYAIMEKAKNLMAVPFTSKWSDLGGWDAVWAESKKDLNRVAVSKGAHAIDCSDTLLRSESEAQEIVGLGLDNIIAIAMPDAVLVADKARAQDVKKVVSELKSTGISQAEIFPKDFRPWGWFESLVLSEKFQVKRICVKPGAALSLQSHSYRQEHWIVVDGTAKVTVDENITTLSEGESVYIPFGAIHRMENIGQSRLVLIEVQTGSYFGEDDIVRYEDIYNR